MSVRRGTALVFAAALGLTSIMAAPVLVAPRERIFGTGEILGQGDPNRDPLVVIEQLRTGRVPAPYLQPATDIPGQGLSLLLGPVAAYNVLVLASFPLAAAAAYLLARHVLGTHGGAMVAALAYAFLPFHVLQAGGHPHVAQTQWLPLYLLALWRCVDRPHFARATQLLAAIAAVTLSNFYGGLIAAASTPVALLGYGLASAGPSRLRRVARTGAVLGAAAILGLALVGLLVPETLLHPGSFAFARTELFGWSARWWSYLVPPADHPLLGARVRAFWARHGVSPGLLEHQQVSVGASLLLLAAVPVWSWLRGDRSSRAVRMAPLLAGLACAAVLCSLSPERRIGPLTFHRPSALLYAVAPMFRAYARFGLMVGLATSLLAGAGAAALWRRPGSLGRLAAVALLGLATFELAPWPPWRFRDVLPTRAHRWLAGQPGSLRVLDCTQGSRESGPLSLALLGHPGALVGKPPFDDCAEPHLADKLAALGYTHVIVGRDGPDEYWRSAHPMDGLAPGRTFSDAAILDVRARSAPAYVEALLGFHPREYDAAATWRWMGRMGAVRVVVKHDVRVAVLELELKAFPDARMVDWLLDGQRRGVLAVTSQWQQYELALGTLPASGATLTLSCRDPAVVAGDVLNNGDRRFLGLAVGGWRVTGAED